MTIIERIFIDNEWHVVATVDDEEDDDDEEDPSPSITVETETATSVSDTEATLTGDLTELKELNEASVWFEWREATEDTWTETPKEQRTTTGPFSYQVTDLAVDTEYEFRARAENEEEGISDTGAIATFTTSEPTDVGDIVAKEDVFALWKVDEGSGELVADSGDSRHDGTIVGGIGWDDSANWPDTWGIVNENPVEGEDYVETTPWSEFFGGTDAIANSEFALAIAFWTNDNHSFMISATHNGANLMRVGTRNAWGPPNRRGFKFYLSSNPGSESDTGELLGVDTDVDDGRIYHVVVNKGGRGTDDWNMYVNGDIESTVDWNTDGSDLGDIDDEATTDVTFFADTSEFDHRQPSEMGIGYIAVWDRTLTEQEVNEEYSRMPFSGGS